MILSHDFGRFFVGLEIYRWGFFMWTDLGRWPGGIRLFPGGKRKA